MVDFASNHRPNEADLMLGEKTRFFKANGTWTHDFFCLDKTRHRGVPTRTEKLKLQNAGLGRKRITFHKNDDAHQVKAKLEQTYPKLATGGGFELLRSSVSPRDLDVMVPPIVGILYHFCVIPQV